MDQHVKQELVRAVVKDEEVAEDGREATTWSRMAGGCTWEPVQSPPEDFRMLTRRHARREDVWLPEQVLM